MGLFLFQRQAITPTTEVNDMGRYFGVALLDNGNQGTLFYDEPLSVGQSVTVWHYDSLGNPVSVTGKFVKWLR